MSEITVELSLPPPILLPNNQKRSVWFAYAKAAAKRNARTAAKYAGMEAWQAVFRDEPKWTSVTLDALFVLPDRRGLAADQDGRIGQLKGHVDGLVDSGLLLDDHGVIWLPIRHEVDKARPRVVLVVRRVEA